MIKSELLTEITLSELPRLLADSNIGAEEKHNGERRTVCKDASGIRDFNREGERGKGLPAHIVNALMAHPLAQFVIDCEWEKDQLVILDVLMLGTKAYNLTKYRARKAAAHKAFDNFNNLIRVTETHEGQKAKSELVLRMAEQKAEGVCFKNMSAIYQQGRSGQHFKLKFWKELDAVVMAPSPKGHNSVEVGVYDNGKLRRICGVSLNGKPSVKMGQVITVEYLYGTSKLEIVQPNFAKIRDDKKAVDCTIDQIIVNKNFR